MIPVVAAASLASCGGGVESASDALLELERLSFVPAGPRRIAGYGEEYATLDVEHALLVDRYEVTRGDWLRLAPADFAPEVAAKWSPNEVPEDTLAWPATWMTLAEARAFAALRGMRLPTAREWLFVAVGASVTPYPWGPRREESVCNTLGLGLDRLAAVGTFESGRAPTPGIYDLLGNAKEWVEGWVPAEEDGDPDGGKARAGDACALGGSYKDSLRQTFGPASNKRLVFNATTLAPEHRADDLGFRCVADAREYLWEKAGEWGASEAARVRVAAVARRWADAVGPLQVKRVLDELADRGQRDGTPIGIAWLLEGVR